MSVDDNELDGDWKEAKSTTDNRTLTEPGTDTEEEVRRSRGIRKESRKCWTSRSMMIKSPLQSRQERREGLCETPSRTLTRNWGKVPVSNDVQCASLSMPISYSWSYKSISHVITTLCL